MCVNCIAGIVERVAWTNGSLHNRVQVQQWSESSMFDVILASILAVTTLLATVVAGVRVLWRKLKQRINASSTG